MSTISLNPRRVVRWNFGERIVYEAVTPKPFGVGRAMEIWNNKGFQMTLTTMSLDEEAFVLAKMRSMRLDASFISAFFAILNETN